MQREGGWHPGGWCRLGHRVLSPWEPGPGAGKREKNWRKRGRIVRWRTYEKTTMSMYMLYYKVSKEQKKNITNKKIYNYDCTGLAGSHC